MITECPPAKHLFICMPTYTGQNCVEATKTLVKGGILLERNNIEVDFEYVKHIPFVHHARNALIKQFLASSATDLLFIDYDVGADPKALVRIAQVGRPFVAGIYPLKTEHRQNMWPVLFVGSRVASDREGLLEPYSVPSGFLRLNRAVFDFLDYEEYTYISTDEQELYRGYLRAEIRNREFIGEDVNLCRRWLALGGKLHLIPNINFTHVGQRSWVGNWHRENVRGHA